MMESEYESRCACQSSGMAMESVCEFASNYTSVYDIFFTDYVGKNYFILPFG